MESGTAEDGHAVRDLGDTATILNAIPDGVIVTGSGAGIVFASDAFCAMTGFRREDLVGHGAPYPFWPPEGEAEIREAIDRFRQGREREFELTFMRADGSRFPVLLTVAYLADGRGGIGVVKDVTGRREAERELMRSRAELSTAQRIARLGSWTRDIATGALSWSDEVYRIFGVARETFTPTFEAFMELVHPDDRESLHGEISRSLAARDTLTVEHRVVRPDGAVRVVAESAEIVRDGDGTPVQMIGTVLDTTSRRQAEDRIAALAEERGRLVADALDAEDRVRGEVARTLHDEVLQDLLSARQDIAEARERAGAASLERAELAIRQATEHLREAVRELYPASLFHGGLAGALELTCSRISRRGGFDVELALGCDPPARYERLIVALVRELLTNVERHSGARHAWVHLGEEGGAVQLTVTDDGRGFGRPEQETALGGGHIGLASARERVRAVGGTLLTGDGPDRGARVVVRLPAACD